MKTNALDKELDAIKNKKEIKNSLLDFGFDNNEDEIIKSRSVIYDIPLEKVFIMENNGFSMEGIDNMASDLKTSNYQSAIAVWKRDDGNFEIIAGHKRFEGIKLLRDQAIENNDADLIDKYSYIKAEVLDGITEENKLFIWLITNYQTRQNTFYTAIHHMDILINLLEDRDADVIKYAFGDGAAPKRINVAEALFNILKNRFNINDVSLPQLKRFLAIKNSGNTALIDAILNKEMTVFEAFEIHRKYTLYQQAQLIESYGTEEYETVKANLTAINRANRPVKRFDSNIEHFKKQYLKNVNEDKKERAEVILKELEDLYNE